MKITVAGFTLPVASRYLSAVPIPVQVLGASSTHVFCNEQARVILLNDGYRQAARLFNKFSRQLDKGVVWADRGWRSTTHHFDPDTGTGIWILASGAEKCARYFYRALKLWRAGREARAMFMLGAAAHLVQDACVPHHARCRLFSGHLEYEKWARKRKQHYKVRSGGLYHLGNIPQEWVAANARAARSYYPYVSQPGDEAGYHQATAVLLPRAQQSTSGFFLFFYRQLFGG